MNRRTRRLKWGITLFFAALVLGLWGRERLLRFYTDLAEHGPVGREMAPKAFGGVEVYATEGDQRVRSLCSEAVAHGFHTVATNTAGGQISFTFAGTSGAWSNVTLEIHTRAPRAHPADRDRVFVEYRICAERKLITAEAWAGWNDLLAWVQASLKERNTDRGSVP